MRAEVIEKEAELYNHDHECYIHIERTKDSPYTFIVSGDSKVIGQAAYNLLCYLSDNLEKPFPQLLRLYKKMYRKFGANERVSMNEE